MSDAPVIRIVAAVILNSNGHLLLVRKRDTEVFMQPGGKFEPGESSHEALIRELREELGFELVEEDFEYVGRFSAEPPMRWVTWSTATCTSRLWKRRESSRPRSRSCAGSTR
jgi:8-oxo-dGTP pyrophosphatase MutT (NUDIX family)